MKIIFNITYRANWGESVYLTGDIAALGNGDYAKALKLNIDGSDRWWLEVTAPSGKAFKYHYFIGREENGVLQEVKHEWGHGNILDARADDTVRIYDRWQDQPYDKPFYSSAFTDCFCRQEHRHDAIHPATGSVLLSVAAPMIGTGQRLAVCGASAALGEWNPAQAIRMSNHDFPLWQALIPAEAVKVGEEYKFLVIDETTGDIVAWEGGENRKFTINASSDEVTLVSGMRFINSLDLWRGAGTAIPVFSLRTDADMGAGDFYDLKELIDWAVETNQRIIQILPVNDTTMTGTWTDSYPYNANSTFALHPMYLRVTELGKLSDSKARKSYADLAKELNTLSEIDYERVTAAKAAYVREIFAQEGTKTLASAEFKAFVARNKSWLMPYAAFCVLRDRFGTPEFDKWGEYAVYSDKILNKVVKENRDEIDLVCYIQYHLDRQMRHVHAYASQKGIALKGDVPIGISRTSADAWTNPRLFNLDCQAGAPPDDFSVLGQNWGFPTYNWEEMNLDGFAWWKARFRKMAEYFDAYRIDHVLGFFRIWQIPLEAVHGLLGTFNPAMPFTPDELKYSYDFTFDPALHTEPYITDETVDALPPEVAAALRQSCLEAIDGHRYRLPAHINTQRKVADYFGRPENRNELAPQMCDALLDMLDQVLFIEDPVQKGKYHPRISGRDTAAYRSLTEYERNAFDRLHEDFYYHRHNDFWREKAMKRLPVLIDATDMLVCGEDLGMIPMCVPEVMDALKILSLKIQRMPSELYAEFGHTKRYPWMSVCATSTHDMSGIREWWTENPESSARFYHDILGLEGDAPAEATPEICRDIVRMHLESPSMLCLLPWQDWMSIDGALRYPDPAAERINIPACPRHYWRYRMHMTLEQLMAAENLNGEIRNLIARSGR